jgi:hypothetical protein
VFDLINPISPNLPLEKQQFGAEGRAHCADHAVAARASRAIKQKILHHRKN